jgi:hypothetical protein
MRLIEHPKAIVMTDLPRSEERPRWQPHLVAKQQRGPITSPKYESFWMIRAYSGLFFDGKEANALQTRFKIKNPPVNLLAVKTKSAVLKLFGEVDEAQCTNAIPKAVWEKFQIKPEEDDDGVHSKRD